MIEEEFTKTAAYSYIQEGLIMCRMLENAEVYSPDVDENFNMAMKFAKGKRYAILVDARTTVHMTKEGMERANRPESYQSLIAQAIVVDSLPNRLVGNFIIKFHKPTAPTRLFSTIESAKTWLLECMASDSKNQFKKAGSESSKKGKLKLFI
jgi:hypothetical protein